MPSAISHTPVLLREVLAFLNPRPGQIFVDGTYGAGGHSLAIWELIKPKGKLIGIDLDPSVKSEIKEKNFVLVRNNYKNLRKILNDAGISQAHGILLDLGLSSIQLGRNIGGFGFQNEGPLDLRFDPSSGGRTAAEILKTASEEELVKIFKEYGEEPLARLVAKKIIASRREGKPVETAEMLVQLVSKIYARKFRNRSRINPATRVFQALRVAVNDEFGNLRTVLPQAVEALAPGGRLAVISFHSGEDRIVKHFFKSEAKKENPRLKILTKKPITPGEDEISENPRSRSAKMRVVEKI